jgi:hypothetical protein
MKNEVLLRMSWGTHWELGKTLRTWWEHLENFFTSKFSYLLFCNPTYRNEIGTANRWGTTKSKPPRPIIMISQSETLSSSQIIFNKLFPKPAFYYPRQSVTLCWAKIIFLSQTGIFWLFSSNFHMLGQILRTTEDSLRGKIHVYESCSLGVSLVIYTSILGVPVSS